MIKLKRVFKPPVSVAVPKFTYLAANGKAPISTTPISKEQAEALDSFCVQVPDGFTVLDFDTPKDMEIVLRIIRTESVKCRVMKTTRGIHVWFRTDRSWNNFTHELLVCGVEADCKSYGKFSCLSWKLNGENREWIIATPWEDVQYMPKYFYPGTKKTKKFSEMGEGDGRNQALTEYIWSLQKIKFTKKDIRNCFRVINNHVFAKPLSQNELDVILRDDTFRDESELDDGNARWFNAEGKFLHNEMAQHLLEKNTMCNLNDRLYWYTDGYYKPIDNALIFHLVHSEHTNSTIRQRKEVLASLKAQVYQEHPPHQDPFILCCANGRLDLKSGRLLPHDPQAFDFQKIPTAYVPNAQSKLLDRTLLKLFPGDGALDLFEEMIGYCLIKTLPYRCAFYMIGEGSNGKSTILSMIRNMLGTQNCSTLVPDQITTDSFLLAELENKLANIGDDITNTRIKDMAAFKKACSGEALSANRKYQAPFDLENYATLIFAANEMPGTADQSYGADSRRIIIPLDARFSPNDPGFDPFIGEKLRKPEVLSALLSRGVVGLHRLLANNKFTMPRSVLEAERAYQQKNTYVGQWVYDEMLDEQDIVGRTTTDVRADFKQWCSDNGLRAKTNPVKFGRDLTKMFPNIITKVAKIDGQSVRIYEKEGDVYLNKNTVM